MDSKMAIVTAWSYGLVAVLAAFLALYLASGWRKGGRSRAMFVAVALCALWGSMGLAFALTGQPLFLAGNIFADVLRFGGWYLFLLVLMQPELAEGEHVPGRSQWLTGLALVLFVVGLAAQTLVVFGIDPALSQRIALFASLAMTVFGLLLVERLFRNVSPDFRWSIKPLCLGLGGVFLFDLYLFSDALLLNRVDVDAFSIRGFAHALGLPLVALSPAWEQAFAESIVGQGEERQLAMAPSQLQEFIQQVREAFDEASGKNEVPVLLTSPQIRPFVRSIIERFRPQTVVMSQNEIHASVRLRTLGQV